jgi:hypothetical protein
MMPTEGNLRSKKVQPENMGSGYLHSYQINPYYRIFTKTYFVAILSSQKICLNSRLSTFLKGFFLAFILTALAVYCFKRNQRIYGKLIESQ